MDCPTPWKEPMTKKAAKRTVRSMQSRARTSKRKAPAVEAYPCECGNHHIAGKRYQKQRMV